jgi:quinol monooxygenase YgiN
MKFIQIIEFSTSRIDEVDALEQKWLEATEGKRTLLRQLKTRDRDAPDAYVLIAEFPSYEDAMRNNILPETQEISEQMLKLAEGEVTFRNLDVLDER